MKIVNRQTFLSMPPGTVFAKYEPCNFGDLCILLEAWPASDNPCDFVYLSLADAIDHDGSADFMEKLDRARETGCSLAMDFECGTRDGLFDADQLFAVFEWQDVLSLIATLQATLPKSDDQSNALKFKSIHEVFAGEPIVRRVLDRFGSLESCIVALANERARLIARLIKADSYAPQRIELPDGKIVTWHCPDELVPLAKMTAMEDAQ